MPNRLLPLLLLLIGACAAGFMGYRRGFETAVEKSAVENRRMADVRREPLRETRSDKMDQLKSLRGRADRSHTSVMKSWRIIRNFSADEIRQALADMPPSHGITTTGWQLTAMLHSRWAEIDPQAALESAIKSPGYGYGNLMAFDAALTAWMNRDPDAAYRWVKSKPELADKANTCNQMMARSMAREDPSGALKKASAEGDMVRKMVGNILATNMSVTPESRAAFLAELEKSAPEELAAGRLQMLTAWGRDDPKGALEDMAELGLDSREAAAKRQSILSSWSRFDPAAALAWMAGKPDALPLATRTQIFTTWTQEDPVAAFEHFDTLGSEPGFGEAVMTKLLLAHGHATLNPFLGSGPWIERNRSNLQTSFQRWAALAPEAAARWQESLDPDLRKELQP